MDIHNQVHQGNMNLYECWVTCDSNLRLSNTVIGICVTDFWMLEVKQEKCSAVKPICQFADELAYALFEYMVQVRMDREEEHENTKDGNLDEY